MQKDHINNVLSLWEKNNTILEPNKAAFPLKIIDQISSTFAAGTYYSYILNFTNLEMAYVDNSINEILGIESNEFTLEKLFEVMHPEDLEMMHKKEKEAINFLFKKISTEEIPLYKVVYLMRLRDSNGVYKTILHQAQATNVSLDGKVQQVIAVHTDISYLPIPFDHKVSFISNVRPSYYSIIPEISMQLMDNSFSGLFTAKEIQLLKLLSEGKNYREIARTTGVSPHTINTHKKNILKKSHSNTVTELIAKCIREGIV